MVVARQGLLGLSFVSIVFISIKAIEESNAVETSAMRQAAASFAAPGTIMLINAFITTTARMLAKWEGHATYGSLQCPSHRFKWRVLPLPRHCH